MQLDHVHVEVHSGLDENGIVDSEFVEILDDKTNNRSPAVLAKDVKQGEDANDLDNSAGDTAAVKLTDVEEPCKDVEFVEVVSMLELDMIHRLAGTEIVDSRSNETAEGETSWSSHSF